MDTKALSWEKERIFRNVIRLRLKHCHTQNSNWEKERIFRNIKRLKHCHTKKAQGSHILAWNQLPSTLTDKRAVKFSCQLKDISYIENHMWQILSKLVELWKLCSAGKTVHAVDTQLVQSITGFLWRLWVGSWMLMLMCGFPSINSEKMFREIAFNLCNETEAIGILSIPRKILFPAKLMFWRWQSP